MVEAMLIHRINTDNAIGIKNDVFNLFQGWNEILDTHNRKKKMSIENENKELFSWVGSVLSNLQEVSAYIDRNYSNTYRFIPYFTRKEPVPYSYFIRNVLHNPTINHQERIQSSGIYNKQNAEHVRTTIHKLLGVFTQLYQQKRFTRELRQKIRVCPKVRRLTFVQSPSLQHKRSAPSVKDQSTPKKKRSIPPPPSQQLPRTTPRPTTTIYVPYLTVHPQQQVWSSLPSKRRSTF